MFTTGENVNGVDTMENQFGGSGDATNKTTISFYVVGSPQRMQIYGRDIYLHMYTHGF